MKSYIILSLLDTLLEIEGYPTLLSPSTFSDSSTLCSFDTNVSCLSDVTNEDYPRKRARTELREREVNVQVNFFSKCFAVFIDLNYFQIFTVVRNLQNRNPFFHFQIFQELKEYILKAPGGKEVVFFYRNNRTLDDKHRKRLVNIVVNHMLQDTLDVLPSNHTKATYASAIVQLFPALRDKTTEDGFVSSVFYGESSMMQSFIYRKLFLTQCLKRVF